MPAVAEQRSVVREQLSGERHDVDGAAAIVAELGPGGQLEVVNESCEDAWIGARPGEDGLLVVTDREQVAMTGCESVDDRVLDAVQVLELVDENAVPARANRSGNGLVAQD